MEKQMTYAADRVNECAWRWKVTPSGVYADGSPVFASEDQLQAACAEWFWNTKALFRRMLYAVNNNSHNAIAGNRNRTMGVVAGVADFSLICWLRVRFIEMKLPNKTQQDEQKDFERKVVARGHTYDLCYTLNQFKELVNEYTKEDDTIV